MNCGYLLVVVVRQHTDKIDWAVHDDESLMAALTAAGRSFADAASGLNKLESTHQWCSQATLPSVSSMTRLAANAQQVTPYAGTSD